MSREHTPRPGATWETVLRRVERLDEQPDTGPDEPAPPRPNRATRRALARANRKAS